MGAHFQRNICDRASDAKATSGSSFDVVTIQLNRKSTLNQKFGRSKGFNWFFVSKMAIGQHSLFLDNESKAVLLFMGEACFDFIGKGHFYVQTPFQHGSIFNFCIEKIQADPSFTYFAVDNHCTVFTLF